MKLTRYQEQLAPTLHSDRLILRAHQLLDFERCCEMWTHPEVIRYTIGQSSPPQRTWQRMLGYTGHWAMLGFGYWAVVERKSGLYIGELGFADFKRDINPAMSGIPEMGWALMPSFHGQGYATEALLAAIAWGDQNFYSKRSMCLIHPNNLTSLRVAEKLGYRLLIQAQDEGESDLLLERT